MAVRSIRSTLDMGRLHLSEAEASLGIARRLRAAVWVFDIDRARIVFANDAACQLWQAHTVEDLFARALPPDMPPTVATRFKPYQFALCLADSLFP